MVSSKSNLRLHVACRGRDWLYELLFVIRMRMYNTYKREGNNYIWERHFQYGVRVALIVR